MAEEDKKKEEEKSWRERWDALKGKDKEEEKSLLGEVRPKEEHQKRPDSQSAGVTVLPQDTEVPSTSLLDAVRPDPTQQSVSTAPPVPTPQNAPGVIPMANAAGVNQMPMEMPGKQLASNPEEPTATPAQEPEAAPEQEPQQPEPGAAPPPMQTVNFSGPTERTRAALEQAQGERHRAEHIANLGRAFNLLGAGLARANPSEAANELYKNIEEQGRQKEQDIKELMAHEESDPNSAVSSGFRDYVKGLGVNLQGASAADAAKLLPTIYKKYIDQVNIAAKSKLTREIQSQKQQFSDEELMKKLDAAKAIAAQKMTASAAAKKAAEDRFNTTHGDAVAAQADRINSRIQGDAILKPLSQNAESLGKARELIQDKTTPLTPQKLSEVQQDLVASMNLRGNTGATEGKIRRNEIDTWRLKLAQYLQQYAGQSDVDMRKVDPTLVKTVESAVNFLYNATTKSRDQREAYLTKLHLAGAGGDSTNLGKRLKDIQKVMQESHDKPMAEEAKPKKVIQNGHTYMLNEKTGQYE